MADREPRQCQRESGTGGVTDEFGAGVDEVIAEDGSRNAKDTQEDNDSHFGERRYNCSKGFGAQARLEAKKPTYMTTTTAMTTSAPTEPNCPRVWTICGTPSVGPWADEVPKRYRRSPRGGQGLPNDRKHKYVTGNAR